jgi:hypothetical protein
MFPFGTRRSRGSYSRVGEDSDVQTMLRRRRRREFHPFVRRLVNEVVFLWYKLVALFVGGQQTLPLVFSRPREDFEVGLGHVTPFGAVGEGARGKRPREEHDPHTEDGVRFRELDEALADLDEDSRGKLDERVSYLARFGDLRGDDIILLRYRLLYMMLSEQFPSRPLNAAAKDLFNAVRDIAYNYPGEIKSMQIDPTRGLGSPNGFAKGSRCLDLESWPRSNDMFMTASPDDMRFMGGHPVDNMLRRDMRPCFTRQIGLVHNG